MLVERMLDHYRARFTDRDGWQPPPPGTLTTPAGGFSGGPFGLAVRYALRGAGDARECVWLETSRMGGALLMRLDPRTGEVTGIDEMQDAYVVGTTEAETRGALERMHAHNAAFWQRVHDLGLDDDLPTHTVINAYLTSAASGDLEPRWHRRSPRTQPGSGGG